METVGALAGRFRYAIPRHDPEELRHAARAGSTVEDQAGTPPRCPPSAKSRPHVE
jgi:hypothetical protein